MNHTRISASAGAVVVADYLHSFAITTNFYLPSTKTQFVVAGVVFFCGVRHWPPRHLSPVFLGSLFNCGLKW